MLVTISNQLPELLFGQFVFGEVYFGMYPL